MASLFKKTTTYDPVFCLLNLDNEDKKDELTQRWKDNKIQELNFIGIVVSTTDNGEQDLLQCFVNSFLLTATAFLSCP